MNPRRKRSGSGRIWLPLLLGVGLVVVLCGGCWAGFNVISSRLIENTAVKPGAGALRLAYSPEKELLFEQLVADFNSEDVLASAGERVAIEAVQMDPEAMIDAALAGEVEAIVPDSSVWLDVLDRTYADQVASQESLVGRPPLTSGVTRWAVSPVIIAMWEETAREMGWPERSIGWDDLLDRAQSDPDFKWSHPSTSYASGLLATLAQFYAGAGITRGLTDEMARSEEVIEYVGAIQKTVRFYGEGEWAVIQRALDEGDGFLDAFVVQEQLAIYFNQQPDRPGQLVAIYPTEGTLWEDHPLALIELATLTPAQRQTYTAFRQYLTSASVQQRVLQAGYRPADLDIPIDGPGSPINASNGADPAQPVTTLQMPGPSVVEVVRDVWWLTKRHTNVYLVVDISGSMAGEKLERTQEALLNFLEQIKGEDERVGLITFSSDVYVDEELGDLGVNRRRITSAVTGLEADQYTALLDAVAEAYGRLQKLGDRERINAIVVMTDGQENDSFIALDTLVDRIERGNRSGVPVVIFCIAYGEDAEMETLEALAAASGGQVRSGDMETIRGLYKILSTYF